MIQHGPIAWAIKRVMGVASSRTLPGFGRSLRRWHERRDPPSQDRPTVLLYPDCFTTWSEPDVGRDAIRLLEAFGYRVVMPRTGCCARTLISAGLLDKASAVIGESAASLHAAIVEHDAVAVVAVEPSCATTLQQEWQELRTSASEDVVKRIAELSDTVEGFIASNMGSHPETPAFKSCATPLPIHQHCHQKHRAALTEVFLRCCGWPQAEVIDTGCCGMAGAFGYEARHEQLSREIAEQSLDALRNHVGPVAACGTSCRHQLADVMRLTGVHPVSLAAGALLR
jgi:Fe-S oxidoreductase